MKMPLESFTQWNSFPKRAIDDLAIGSPFRENFRKLQDNPKMAVLQIIDMLFEDPRKSDRNIEERISDVYNIHWKAIANEPEDWQLFYFFYGILSFCFYRNKEKFEIYYSEMMLLIGELREFMEQKSLPLWNQISKSIHAMIENLYILYDENKSFREESLKILSSIPSRSTFIPPSSPLSSAKITPPKDPPSSTKPFHPFGETDSIDHLSDGGECTATPSVEPTTAPPPLVVEDSTVEAPPTAPPLEPLATEPDASSITAIATPPALTSDVSIPDADSPAQVKKSRTPLVIVSIGVLIVAAAAAYMVIQIPTETSSIGQTTDSENISGRTIFSAMNFVYIKPTQDFFWMGSHEHEPQRIKEMETLHKVSLSGFWIKETEVTQKEWKELQKGLVENPSQFTGCGDQCPVERVSWWDAVRFANFISLEDQTVKMPCYILINCDGTPGKDFKCEKVINQHHTCDGYRLPTESEWEYAARGNTETYFYNENIDSISEKCESIYEVDEIGWHCGNSFANYAGHINGKGTQPVRQKKENPFHLFDMSGNVAEWVWDWRAPYQPGTQIQSNPQGPTEGRERIVRGGSWDVKAHFLRSASRYTSGFAPTTKGYGIGFRLIKSKNENLKITEKTKNLCSVDRSGCSPNAHCSMDIISVRCECKDGFNGNGVACRQIHDGDLRVFNGFKFKYIPNGTFVMGSPTTERGRIPEEIQHEVMISHFWMKEAEVTQKEWQDVMGNNHSHFDKTDDRPVNSVSWHSALAFCNKLSEKHSLTLCYDLKCQGEPGVYDESRNSKYTCSSVEFIPSCTGYRLPTEAEWEYAARAGSVTAFYNGEITDNNRDSNTCSRDPILNQSGIYCDNSPCVSDSGCQKKMPEKVKSKTENAWGLYDTAGNVMEWCWDWYAPYDVLQNENPSGPTKGEGKIVRGGAYATPPFENRSARRGAIPPEHCSYGVGFRIVKNIPRAQ
jgi:formylglycine-generating enzyme required for sulfatase activity